jgi:predicted transposase YbfD/YdcC
VVTIDAMGTQRAIAAAIVEKEGDYVLCVKGNQGRLHMLDLEVPSTMTGATLINRSR